MTMLKIIKDNGMDDEDIIFRNFIIGSYKISDATITRSMNAKRTIPAIVSFISPACLLYSGETKSMSFSKFLLNNSRMITKKITIRIVIKYSFETFRIRDMLTANIPNRTNTLSILSLEIP